MAKNRAFTHVRVPQASPSSCTQVLQPSLPCNRPRILASAFRTINVAIPFCLVACLTPVHSFAIFEAIKCRRKILDEDGVSMMKRVNHACVAFVFLSFIWSASTEAGTQKDVTKPKNVSMPDAVKTGTGFSFKSGIIPLVDYKTGKYDLELDFFWDPIGTGVLFNNSINGMGFTGMARAVDLGKVTLEEAKEKPTRDGNTGLSNDATKIGHSYCIRNAKGDKIGFIHVQEYDPAKRRFLFSWKMLHAEK